MKYSRETLNQIETETGFRAEVLEKTLLLFELLNDINKNEYLNNKLVLKGGTALNLFYFEIPRLSIDIDFNAIGIGDKSNLIAVRPKIEAEIENVIKKKDYRIRRKKDDYALTSYYLRYNSALENIGNLKIDINYTMRVPLFDVEHLDSKKITEVFAENILLLNKNELFASKLTTVFARGASRDLFDIHNIVNSLENFDLDKVRLAFLVFGAMNRIDFTNINIDYIKINTIEMKNRLIPLIGKSIINKSKNFALNIEESVKKATKIVLPYKENEIEFLSSVNKHGIIKPELITNDTKLQQNIISQPHLVWKCKNVKEYRKNRNGS